MNNKLINNAVVQWVFLITVSLSSFVAQAVDATFKAELVEDPCVVVPGMEDQIVDFQEIPLVNFYLNQSLNPQPFSIYLEECDISLGKTVKVSFTGIEDPLQQGLLKTEGAAKGFAIAIKKSNNDILAINSGSAEFALEDNADHTNKLDFLASVMAAPEMVKNKTLESGDFSATATVGLEYP